MRTLAQNESIDRYRWEWPNLHIFSDSINHKYTRHYKQWLLYIFSSFFNAVYISEWLVLLQTIELLNKEILQFLSQKSTVYDQEWFQNKSGL